MRDGPQASEKVLSRLSMGYAAVMVQFNWVSWCVVRIIVRMYQMRSLTPVCGWG